MQFTYKFHKTQKTIGNCDCIMLLTIVEERTVVSERHDHVDHTDALGEFVQTTKMNADVCQQLCDDTKQNTTLHPWCVPVCQRQFSLILGPGKQCIFNYNVYSFSFQLYNRFIYIIII